MKIAYIIAQTLLGTSNGVVRQALTWKSGLKNQGVEVILVTPWERYDWSSFDAIHIFGMGQILEILPGLRASGAKRIMVSPIFDSNRPIWQMNALSRIDIPSLRIKPNWASLRTSLDNLDTVLVRSDFESSRIQYAFGVPKEKIECVPLSPRFTLRETINKSREPYCLHVSLLSAEIKNVRRLVDASIKYDFRLVLCGGIRNPSFESWLQAILKKHSNIKYLGSVDDHRLKDLYSTAKVFALPSTMEGVGLVALEAAIHGADVVVTNLGAPKEYYDDFAKTVDPYSVKEIGEAIVGFLGGNTFQPELARHINQKYSLEVAITRLIEIYRDNK